jgi:hypothetical protein
MSENKSSSENKITETSEIPNVGHQGIPTWIKIMWALGILWIIIYVIKGLNAGPATW